MTSLGICFPLMKTETEKHTKLILPDTSAYCSLPYPLPQMQRLFNEEGRPPSSEADWRWHYQSQTGHDVYLFVTL